MGDKWLNTSEIIDKNAKKPCHRLGWCPYGKLVEEFPIKEQKSEYTCKVFHHDCPIFYHIEYTSEKYSQEDYEKDIEVSFEKGGLNEIFSKDKIAEYWYQVGSDHSDDDNLLRLKYAVEKILKEEPNLKEVLKNLQEIIQTVSLDELYRWNSQK